MTDPVNVPKASDPDLELIGAIAVGVLLFLLLAYFIYQRFFKKVKKIEAGLEPGLEVWRIEKMEMAKVPVDQHGHFFTGDSYIVLCTKTTGETYSGNLHFWLGDQSTQDERGAAAILATQLDNQLGGTTVQYREVQEKESPVFRGYFKNGVTYKQGGLESGFKHTVTNASDVKRVIHLKGRRRVKAKEVEMKWSSFNQGDVFIVEIGSDLFQWNGSNSNRYERLKACEIVNQIKNEEKGGKGIITVINEGEDIPETMLQALEGTPDDVGQEILDEFIDLSKPAQLYRVSCDASGKLEVDLIAKAPFEQSSLDTGNCYVVDNGHNGSIFVWKGREASWDERAGAMANALRFITMNGYPASTNIQVMAENSESVLFTQYFSQWRRKDQVVGLGKIYTFEKIAQTDAFEEAAFPYDIKFDVSTLYDKPAFAAEQKMVDDGSGEVEVWRVEASELVPIPSEEYGKFFAGDCYVILYTYTPQSRVEYIIYYWQGADSTKEEIIASSLLAKQLSHSYDGRPMEVRVVQGKEPKHLLSIFGHPLMISFGGYCRTVLTDVGVDSTVLYQVRSTSAGGTKIIQVDLSACMLNSNDAFLVKGENKCIIWVGTGANDLEVAAAKFGADRIGVSEDELQMIKEGQESEEFWSLLGGKEDYASSACFKEDLEANPARLFAISNAKGHMNVEEIPGEFTQSDLEPDDIMMLDTWDQVFIWTGEGANEAERKEAPDLVQEYISKDPRGRDGNCPIIQIKMNSEPVTFTGFFPSWDPSYFEKRKTFVARMDNMQ